MVLDFEDIIKAMKIKSEIEKADITHVKEYLSKKDKYMARFLKIAPEFNLKINSLTSVYQSLIESIIAQQLSGKAAGTIFMRLCSLYNSKQIQPLDIIRSEDDELRSVGISRPKIAAIRDLTEFEMSGELPSLSKLHKILYYIAVLSMREQFLFNKISDGCRLSAVGCRHCWKQQMHICPSVQREEEW